MIQYLNDSMTQSKSGRPLVRAGFFFLGLRFSHARIWIQQFGEARILRQILEVAIIARLEAQRGFRLNRLVECLERFFDVTGQAMQCGQPVKNVFCLRILLQELVEVLARRHIVTHVDQRHRVVVILFRCLELQGWLFHVLVAGEDMHLRPVDQRLVRPAQRFLEVAFGLLEFMLLQCAKPGLVALHRLCVSWIFGHLFLGGYLQCHQTASSSRFSSKFTSELKSKSLQLRVPLSLSPPVRLYVSRSFPQGAPRQAEIKTQLMPAAESRSTSFQSPLMIPARICRAVLPCLCMV